MIITTANLYLSLSLNPQPSIPNCFAKWKSAFWDLFQGEHSEEVCPSLGFHFLTIKSGEEQQGHKNGQVEGLLAKTV